MVATGMQWAAELSQGVNWRTDANLQALDSLNPAVANLAAEHLSLLAAEGIQARITQATRTYTEQDRLYSYGRSAPGSRVTNARGGESPHNFGVAYDIALFDERGRYIRKGSDPLYRRAGEIGERLGFEWGGRWSDPFDPGHFQFLGGNSLAVIRERWEAGTDVFSR